MDTKFFQKASFFWSPEYLDISAWVEHTPFAFWIIEVLKPGIVVELGVHAGTSYFSFCQAIKSINSNTTCYGIDTWEGDEHTGSYGGEIFEKVAAYNAEKYARFSTLIRSTFDEASAYFIDGTIDLLHIDGLHTYEAVKQDFETWLPKLTPHAVVLFHDINVRERNFGVFKLWEELKQQYRNFQFDFGHGLGVLTIGDAVPEELNVLFDAEKEDAYFLFLRNLFSDRGSFFKARMNFDTQLKLESENVAALAANNEQLKENVNGLQLHCNTNEVQYNQLRENFETLKASNAQLQESFKELELYKNAIEAEKNLLATNNSQLENKCAELTEAHKEGVERYEALKLQYATLQEKYDKAISEISKELELKNLSLTDAFLKLSKFKETLNQRNEQVKQQQQTIGWYRDTYELRSFLGVLKEKLRPQNKKAVVHSTTATDHLGTQQATSNHATILQNQVMHENTQYGSLQTRYEQLKGQYDALNGEYEVLKKLMAEGQAAASASADTPSE